MPDEEEDITIDLRLRDYLTGSAATAAHEMRELADETRKVGRALLLLDKRADKAANSLYKLAAATAALRGAQQTQLSTTADLNRRMGEQVQTQRSLQKNLNTTTKKAREASKANDFLRKSFQKLTTITKMAGAALFMVSKALAMIGAAGVAGLAAQQILAVATAMSTMLSFAALIPTALGAVAAIAVAGKMAFGGLSEAIKAAASGDVAALEKAVEKLPKSAKDFVKELTPALKLFKGMKESVQGEFLKGLTKDIPAALHNLEPTIRSGLEGIAKQFSGLVNNIAQYFTTENGKRMFGRFFEAGEDIVAIFSRNVGPLLEGLGDVIEAVQPSWDRLMEAFDGGFSDFNEWIARISNDGSLEDWLNTAFEVVKLLGSALKDIGGIIKGVISAAGGAAGGAGALGALGMALGEVNKWVNSFEGQTALQSFFASLGQIVQAVTPIFGTIAGIIGTVLAPALADLAINLGPSVNTFFQALGSALQLIAPHIGPLAAAFGELLVALSPLLPVLAEVVGVALQNLATLLPMLVPLISLFAQAIGPLLLPFLRTMAELLQLIAPMISVFFTTLVAVLTPLIPIIEQVGTMFQQYMAVHLQRIVEMLPTLIPLLLQLAVAFGQWLMQALNMILPLLPQLLPLMLQIMQISLQLAPVVIMVATAMVRVATAAMPLMGILLRVIGVFLTMATGAATLAVTVIGAFSRLVGGVRSAAGTVTSLIGSLIGQASRLAGPFVSAVGAIVSAFGRISGAVQGAIGAIGNLISRASALASIDINPFRFAGGDVLANQKYTVGEIGKEMFVGKNGQTQMIGVNGIDPNWQAPSDGFIVPSFMLGAFKSLERGMENIANSDSGGVSARELAAIAAGASQQTVEEHYHIPITIMGNVSSEVNIERAVKRAIDKVEQDKKERR